MPKLNDLQSILLATAAQRDSGSLYPLADSIAEAGTRVTKAISALTKAGFVEERDTTDRDAVCRTDGDAAFSVYITGTGLAAIGAGEPDPVVTALADTVPSLAPAPAPTRTTKTSELLHLLQRAEGATLSELIAATGWLPHTARAALTGLRKKGHVIDRGKRGDATCYRIAAVAAA